MGVSKLLRPYGLLYHPYKWVRGQFPIYLDYPVIPRPRWVAPNKAHPLLHEIIDKNREEYIQQLRSFLDISDRFEGIPLDEQSPSEPYWDNKWLPMLDALTLYGFLVQKSPKLYLEIGSGHSTRFARRAIRDSNLVTKLISIDPCPRVEIDKLCDDVIRQPLENVDVEIFSQLDAGDILFFDGSHRSFMNSDVTTFFIEVIPNLRKGVLVQIHDICLPFDYPADWDDRYYNEQYLLACYLLADTSRFTTTMPNNFVFNDPNLFAILDPIWEKIGKRVNSEPGRSYWLEIN